MQRAAKENKRPAAQRRSIALLPARRCEHDVGAVPHERALMGRICALSFNVRSSS